jgi:hypothetical protein
MNTSNQDFHVAAEVLRLQRDAPGNLDLKEVPPTKRGANRLLKFIQGPRQDLDTYQHGAHAGTPFVSSHSGILQFPG